MQSQCPHPSCTATSSAACTFTQFHNKPVCNLKCHIHWVQKNKNYSRKSNRSCLYHNHHTLTYYWLQSEVESVFASCQNYCHNTQYCIHCIYIRCWSAFCTIKEWVKRRQHSALRSRQHMAVTRILISGSLAGSVRLCLISCTTDHTTSIMYYYFAYYSYWHQTIYYLARQSYKSVNNCP